MEEFKKDNDIMSGKGEKDIDWITVKGSHIPLKDGQTPKEAIQQQFGNQTTKKDYGGHSQEITKQPISKEKLKQLVKDILNFEPITLKINGRIITAKFDKYSAQKNIYTRGTSTHEGYLFKLDNIHNLPTYIGTSHYAYSKQETGKDSRQHQGVKEWHYFINKIQTSQGVFDITVNVRDKGSNQFIYEVAFRKNKKV